jgi:hypothetical protein
MNQQIFYQLNNTYFLLTQPITYVVWIFTLFYYFK